MSRSPVRAVGHAVRMAGRGAINRLRCRRRVRGNDHSIRAHGAVLRNVRFELSGHGHRIEIAPNARISDFTVTMEGSGHRLQIGPHTRIWSGSCSTYDDGSNVRIGARSVIYGADFGVTEGGAIVIGDRCLVAAGVDLRNGDSHSIVDAATGQRINPAADILIEDHVWIGMRVVVLKGSRIGAEAVIGAASVVAGDIPAGCVAAGTPARVVLEGTSWMAERL